MEMPAKDVAPEIAREDGGALLAAHRNGDRRGLPTSGSAVSEARLWVSLPLRCPRARSGRSLSGDLRAGAPAGAGRTIRHGRSIPGSSPWSRTRCGRTFASRSAGSSSSPDRSNRRREGPRAGRRGPRFGAGDHRLARARDPGASFFAARGAGPRDPREPSDERHRVHSRASRRNGEDAAPSRASPFDGRLRPTHESDIMNENCERLREEAALLGRATDEMREHAASCSDCSEFLSKLAALESDLAALPSRDASDELVAKLLARPELSGRPSARWRVWAMAAASVASMALALQDVPQEPGHRRSTATEARLRATAATLRKRKGSRQLTRGAAEKSRQPGLHRAEKATSLPPMESAGGTTGFESRARSHSSKGSKRKRRMRPRQARERVVVLAVAWKRESVLLDEKAQPGEESVRREPVYPEAARDARVQGDGSPRAHRRSAGKRRQRPRRRLHSPPRPGGDRSRPRVAIRTRDSDAPRVFRVPVPFHSREPSGTTIAASVEGVPFPGSERLLGEHVPPGRSDAGGPRAPSTRRVLSQACTSPPIRSALPLDATSTGALSLFMHADRTRTHRKEPSSRAGRHPRCRRTMARRRPPMNIGVVLDLPESMTRKRRARRPLSSSPSKPRRSSAIASDSSFPAPGEVLAPETFRRGPLTVALQDLYSKDRRPESFRCSCSRVRESARGRRPDDAARHEPRPSGVRPRARRRARDPGAHGPGQRLGGVAVSASAWVAIPSGRARPARSRRAGTTVPARTGFRGSGASSIAS